MRRFLSEKFAATFAGQLLMRLFPPHDFGKHNLKIVGVEITRWMICGSLPLKAHGEDGASQSRVKIFIEPDWLIAPPRVIVPEPFIRRETDWHADRDGGLCYVLKNEWRDRLDKILTKSNEDIAYVMDYAATWLLAASDSLITRHLLGSRHGIDKWPKDWDAYAHGDAGVRQYEREKNTK